MRMLLCLLLLSACEDGTDPPAVVDPIDASQVRDMRPDPPDTNSWDMASSDSGDASSDSGDASTAQDSATDALLIDSAPRPDQSLPIECPAPIPGHLGVHVRDVNANPLEPGDRVEVTVSLTADGVHDAPLWIALQHGNLQVSVDAPLQINGVETPFELEGGNVLITLPHLENTVITYTATVTGRDSLLALFATLHSSEAGCPNPSGRAAALLQLIGGNGKVPVCIDLAEFASIQIAPDIPLRNTAAYREANGARADLTVDDFIFCPQHPTIVHSAEFCAVYPPGLPVRLAGHHQGGAQWQVDDLTLFEVVRGGQVIGAATTSQHHPGGDTFWCGEIETLMCTDGCTASLRRGEAVIDLLAVAEATGDQAREFVDGVVRLEGLLPMDENPFQLRVTALDVGVEGTITPGLYLIMGE